jgi:hypothetical protein
LTELNIEGREVPGEEEVTGEDEEDGNEEEESVSN